MLYIGVTPASDFLNQFEVPNIHRKRRGAVTQRDNKCTVKKNLFSSWENRDTVRANVEAKPDRLKEKSMPIDRDTIHNSRETSTSTFSPLQTLARNKPTDMETSAVASRKESSNQFPERKYSKVMITSSLFQPHTQNLRSKGNSIEKIGGMLRTQLEITDEVGNLCLPHQKPISNRVCNSVGSVEPKLSFFLALLSIWVVSIAELQTMNKLKSKVASHDENCNSKLSTQQHTEKVNGPVSDFPIDFNNAVYTAETGVFDKVSPDGTLLTDLTFSAVDLLDPNIALLSSNSIELLVPVSNGKSLSASNANASHELDNTHDIITEVEVENRTLQGDQDSLIRSNDTAPIHGEHSLIIVHGNRPQGRKRRNANPQDDNVRRKLNPMNWRTVKAKEAYAKGIAHTSLRGKLVPERKLGDGCSSICKRKCHLNVSETERQSIFKRYYCIGEHSRKWDFIARLVKTSPVKRRISQSDFSRRNFSHSYFFQLSNDSRIEVCQKFFLGTLDVSQQVVRTALKKMEGSGGVISPDKRGKYKKRKIVGSTVRNNVKEHIAKFKTVESHYTRKTSKSKYLPEGLNCRKMFSMYKLERGESIPHTATLRQYRDVFKQDFNLKFFRPKKDQCSQCLNWKNRTTQVKTKKGEAEKFNLHIDNKNQARELKDADTKRAKTEASLCVASFDLQKILYSPKGENAAFFYRSKLKCYNLTVLEHGSLQGYCYVWDQTIANKGSVEVASCLYSFIKSRVEDGKSEFIFYSDNCWSQNKNSIVFSMLNIASIKFNVKITQRYLEKGHTQIEVDSIHALIEKRSKNVDVYTPAQWYALIKSAKVNAPFYKVKEMSQEDILDFKEVASHHVWTKISISKLKEISMKNYEVTYRTSYASNASTVSVLPARVGRPVNWATFRLKQAYTRRIRIPQNVLEDIMWFCEGGHIPTAYLPYYYFINNISNEVGVPEGLVEDPGDDNNSSNEENSSSEEEMSASDTDSQENNVDLNREHNWQDESESENDLE